MRYDAIVDMVDYGITPTTRMEAFILHYKSALASDMTRQELATILSITVDTVRKRRARIYSKTGLNLPHLDYDADTEHPSKEKLDIYESELIRLIGVADKFKVHNVSTAKNPNYKKTKFIITSAQNATPIHEKFLQSILTYVDENDAELIVIPYRYRNPTSLWSATAQDDDYWDSRVVPYLMDKHIQLNERFRVMGHIKIQPTAVSPLSGLDSLTGEDSAVFGHPLVELKSIPTPARKMPKILSTTGSITAPNFTDSKAGHKGDFHHSYAASVVEIDGDMFFHRHIHADEKTGEFYDLDKLYTPTGVIKSTRVEALITGDIHAEFHDPDVEKATYTDKNSIMNVLNPKVWAIHDAEDFYSRNHHHRGNDIIAFGKHHFGARNNVERSLQLTADFIDSHSRDGMINLVVKSNHDEALDRWLRESNPKEDPENAVFYHYMKYHQYKNLIMTDTGFNTIDPFEFWCRYPESETGLKNVDNTIFLDRDDSYTVKDIEIGFHGDIGPNGSRGSIRNFSKIGPKVVIGHSHTPGIYHGAYQVGVSARLNLEYAKGPSSWLHTHCVIYPDGHRTLIHVVNGRWKK